MASPAEEIRRQLEESARVKQGFSSELVGRIAQFAEKSAAALRSGGKLVFFGNGGSASDAQHLAAELVVRLRAERKGLAALALTTNPSVLTAAGNDYGFERIFSRQIEYPGGFAGCSGRALHQRKQPEYFARCPGGPRSRRLPCSFFRRDGRRARREGRSALECSFSRRAAHPGVSHHHRPHRVFVDRKACLRLTAVSSENLTNGREFLSSP
jgi:hypothetical protein